MTMTMIAVVMSEGVISVAIQTNLQNADMVPKATTMNRPGIDTAAQVTMNLTGPAMAAPITNRTGAAMGTAVKVTPGATMTSLTGEVNTSVAARIGASWVG